MGSPATNSSGQKFALCHETGLGIISRPEWHTKSEDGNYEASVKLLDSSILKTSVSGYSTRKESIQTARLIDQIRSGCFDTKKGYVQLFDMKDSTGFSSASRKLYFTGVNNTTGALAHIFYNTSPMFRISLRLGRKLNRITLGIHIVNTYKEAVELAQKIVSSDLRASNSVQIDTTLKPFQPILNDRCPVSGFPVSRKKEWTDIRIGQGYSSTFEIIGNTILHIRPQGSAGINDINRFFEIRASVIEAAFGNTKPFFEITNFKTIPTPPKRIRTIYSKRLQEDKDRLLGFVGYEASRGVRFSSNIGKRLIKPDYPVAMVKDYTTAVELAVQSIEHHKKTAQRPDPASITDPGDTTRKKSLPVSELNYYVDELLLFLGNIDWEIHGLDTTINKIPASHPFRLVFEAIALIKTDLDTLSRDRQKVLEALRKSEHLYRLLAENARDVIWTSGLDMQPIYISPSAQMRTGYTVEELLNQKIDFPLTRESSRYASEVLMDELEKEKIHGADPFRSVLLEFENTHKKGFRYWTEARVSFVRDKHGRPTGLIGVSRDISERKQAEKEARLSLEQLKKAQAQLIESEKMAALGGLVAGVSHEISTPLGISVTASSFLTQKTKEFEDKRENGSLSPDEIDRFARITLESTALISNNLKRAAELINSFKQVAVDQSNELVRSFDLKTYTGEILNSLNPKIRRTNHTIALNCPDGIEFKSYPGAYSQIITNLVMNSILHGFDSVRAGEITIDISDNDDHVAILFTDNGKGMEETTLKQLYNPFYTTKRSSGGTGLGMHIVYNIITRKLNGRIECTSKPGNGTRYLIQLPH